VAGETFSANTIFIALLRVLVAPMGWMHLACGK
jgi:hypothetical protein